MGFFSLQYPIKALAMLTFSIRNVGACDEPLDILDQVMKNSKYAKSQRLATSLLRGSLPMPTLLTPARLVLRI